MAERPEALDGFKMAEAVLAHAVLHFQLVKRGSDRVEPHWENEADGSRLVSWRVFKARDIGGEVVWQIEVKHCLEDVRSALDYCAYEVYERVCCTEPSSERPHVHRQVGFPVPKRHDTRAQYATRVEGRIPGLHRASIPAFEKFLEFGQWSEPPLDWLPSLDENWNIVKHRRLPEPSRRSAKLGAMTGGVPPDCPKIEVRLFSLDPPREVLSTLQQSIESTRRVVTELRGLTRPRSPRGSG